jgi:hypothetical protein
MTRLWIKITAIATVIASVFLATASFADLSAEQNQAKLSEE